MSKKIAQYTALDRAAEPPSLYEDYNYPIHNPVLPFPGSYENDTNTWHSIKNDLERSVKHTDLQRRQQQAEDIPVKPLHLKYPDLQQEDIRYSPLSPEQLQHLNKEDQEQIEERKKWPSHYHSELPKHHNVYEANKTIVPEEARKRIHDLYRYFRETAMKFQAAYNEANRFAENEPELDYTKTYTEIIKDLPQFVIASIETAIGELFGVTTRKSHYYRGGNKANELMAIINSGMNILNITPLNYDEEERKLRSAERLMREILSEYDRRKKVLQKLPSVVERSAQGFLKQVKNRNFLRWMEEYHGNDKKDFIQNMVEAVSTQRYDKDINILRLDELKKIKTYKSIYEKAAKFPEDVYQSLRRKSSKTIEDRLATVTTEKLKGKLGTLSLILQNDDEYNKFVELRKYLNKQFRIDLPSIVNFANNITQKYYENDPAYQEYKKANPEYHQKFIDDKKKQFVESFIKHFTDSVKRNIGAYGLAGEVRNSVEKLILSFTKNNIFDVKAFSQLKEDELDKIVALKIRELVAMSLPNFNAGNYPSNVDEKLPKFGNMGSLIRNVGSFSIENLTNQMHKALPFVPKDFVLNFVRSLFKASASQSAENVVQSFGVFPILNTALSKGAAHLIMKLLEKSGKVNPDSFAKIFTNYFIPLRASLNKFKTEMPRSLKFSDDAVLDAHMTAIRNITTIDQDLKNLSEFITFAHNSGNNLNRRDFTFILKNKNFTQFAKLGIVKKVLEAYAKIKSEGGIAGIRKEYGVALKELIKGEYISKDFFNNITFITNLVISGEIINPSSELFKKAFEAASAVETDLEILEMSGAFSALVKDYKPKDKKLFDLNFQVNDKYRFRVLKDKDPRMLRVGVETDCCQRIGGVADSAAKDSFINPLAGVLVLEWQSGGQWHLVSQSYFHYVPDDNSFILDNVETAKKAVQQSGVDLSVMYAYLARHVKEKFNVNYFLSGEGYSKLNKQSFGTKSLDTDPRSFDPRSVGTSTGYYSRSEVYTDWHPNSSIDLLDPRPEVVERMDKEFGKPQEEIKQAFTTKLRRIILGTMAFVPNITVSS